MSDMRIGHTPVTFHSTEAVAVEVSAKKGAAPVDTAHMVKGVKHPENVQTTGPVRPTAESRSLAQKLSDWVTGIIQRIRGKPVAQASFKKEAPPSLEQRLDQLRKGPPPLKEYPSNIKPSDRMAFEIKRKFDRAGDAIGQLLKDGNLSEEEIGLLETFLDEQQAEMGSMLQSVHVSESMQGMFKACGNELTKLQNRLNTQTPVSQTPILRESSPRQSSELSEMESSEVSVESVEQTAVADVVKQAKQAADAAEKAIVQLSADKKNAASIPSQREAINTKIATTVAHAQAQVEEALSQCRGMPPTEDLKRAQARLEACKSLLHGLSTSAPPPPLNERQQQLLDLARQRDRADPSDAAEKKRISTEMGRAQTSISDEDVNAVLNHALYAYVCATDITESNPITLRNTCVSLRGGAAGELLFDNHPYARVSMEAQRAFNSSDAYRLSNLDKLKQEAQGVRERLLLNIEVAGKMGGYPPEEIERVKNVARGLYAELESGRPGDYKAFEGVFQQYLRPLGETIKEQNRIISDENASLDDKEKAKARLAEMLAIAAPLKLNVPKADFIHGILQKPEMLEMPFKKTIEVARLEKLRG